MVTELMMMLGVFLVPTIFYNINMSRSHGFWPARAHAEKTQQQAGEGAFRSATLQSEKLTEVPAGPPLLLRIAAYSGYFLGQMAIPGFLAGLVGVAVATTSAGTSNALFGLIAFLASMGGISLCLWGAGSVWNAANSVFESKFENAESKAKKALLFANIINIPTILVALMAAVGAKDIKLLGFTLYPIISLLQATFALFAVRRHEQDFREALAAAMPSQSSNWPTGVRAEPFVEPWPPSKAQTEEVLVENSMQSSTSSSVNREK